MIILKIKSDIFVDVYLFGLVILKCFGMDSTDSIYTKSTVIFSVLLFFFCLMNKWNKQKFICSMVMIALAICSTIMSHRVTVLMAFISIIAIMQCNQKMETIKRVALIWMTVASFRMLLAYLGIIDCQQQMLYEVRNAGHIAYGFGFGNKNQFGIAIVIVLLSVIYIFYDKIKFLYLVIIAGIGLYLSYMYAQCTTAMLLVLFTLLIYEISKYAEKIFYVIGKLVIPGCVFFSFITAIFYNKVSIFNYINSLSTGRIGLANAFLKKYPISLLGADIQIGSAALDNGYVLLYCTTGIVISMFFIYVYQKTMAWMCERKMKKEVLITIVFAILGISEGGFLNPFMNYSILFIGLYLSQKLGQSS